MLGSLATLFYLNMTTKQIIADIRNISTSGSNPIDFKIEDSQILFWVNQIRSKLISQDLQKRKDISDIWLQQINCLQLSDVDKSECCEITTNCKILRTVRKIPNTIEFNNDNLIIRVETPIGEIISKTTPFESKYSEFDRFSRNKLRWYFKNNYIYLIGNTSIENINITGLFENPNDLIAYTACNGSTCFSYNSEYPCSLKMAEDITNIILKTKVYPYLQYPADNTNDSNNESKQPLK
jgi:hypothetical protein